MEKISGIDFSVLDLAIIREGHDASEAFQRSVDLAQHIEQWGYRRFWMAEHHNMAHVGSSATSVLVGHIAGKTSTLRVGAGGIMLPNHAPLMVAEQFGTLESLYPGRIDLGLGRAPGTDQATAKALRRNRLETVEEFPQDLEELQTYLSEENIDGRVHAVPGEGMGIPIYLLGSSMSSAVLAAKMGLPYAFASHFAPAQFLDAVQYYRSHFQASKTLSSPYVISCINVFLNDNGKEAHRLASSFYRMALGIIRRTSEPLKEPVDNISEFWSPEEAKVIREMMACTFIGDPTTVRKDLNEFLKVTKVDELMVSSAIYDHDARLRSYELLADFMEGS